jgi:hypothetical protein
VQVGKQVENDGHRDSEDGQRGWTARMNSEDEQRDGGAKGATRRLKQIAMMSIGLEASHGLERPRLAWSVNMQKRLSTRGKGNCGAAWGRLARRITNSPNIELISDERAPVKSRRTLVRHRGLHAAGCCGASGE